MPADPEIWTAGTIPGTIYASCRYVCSCQSEADRQAIVGAMNRKLHVPDPEILRLAREAIERAVLVGIQDGIGRTAGSLRTRASRALPDQEYDRFLAEVAKLEERLPCPICGLMAALEVAVRIGDRARRVRCKVCLFDGPSAETEETAVERWNHLPRSFEVAKLDKERDV